MSAKKKNYIAVQEGDKSQTSLEFNNVTITLPEGGDDLIQDFSLKLAQGERLIITGPSGCGKSSLIKAITDIWENGAGTITLPGDAEIMCVSQKAYMPNTSLRGILSFPKAVDSFKDDEIAKALRDVGHDKLPQYLPGQQIGFMTGELTKKIAGCSLDDGAESLMMSLETDIKALVHDNIDITQYMLSAEETELHNDIALAIKDRFRETLPDKEIFKMTNRLVHCFSENLMSELMEDLSQQIPDILKEIKRRNKSLSPAAQTYFMQILDKSLSKHMKAYLKEKHKKFKAENISNPQELAQMNERWGNYITQQIQEGFSRYFDNVREHDTWLKRVFNRVAAGFGARRSKRNALQASKYMIDRMGVYLDKQLVNGDVLSKRLSGGEQQRLIFARILLHKPDILILDEITSALDRKSGNALYQMLLDNLPGTTIISVAHQPNIIDFHTKHAKIGEDKKVTVSDVRPKPA